MTDDDSFPFPLMECVVCGGERDAPGRLMCDGCSKRADAAIVNIDVAAPPRV